MIGLYYALCRGGREALEKLDSGIRPELNLIY
jgi:hypothetical protein